MNRQAALLYALAIVRITVGFTFFLHGAQKVFGWFGGPGLATFVQWSANYGISSFWAYCAAGAECLGGFLLMTGIVAELGALLVIPVMIGAIFLIHGTKAYFVQNQGFEYPFVLMLFALAIIVGGPGHGALWDPVKKYRE